MSFESALVIFHKTKDMSLTPYILSGLYDNKNCYSESNMAPEIEIVAFIQSLEASYLRNLVVCVLKNRRNVEGVGGIPTEAPQ